jgi:hypothetical protein
MKLRAIVALSFISPPSLLFFDSVVIARRSAVGKSDFGLIPPLSLG